MDPRTTLYNEAFLSSGLTIYYSSKTTTRAKKEQPNADDVLVDIFKYDETIKVKTNSHGVNDSKMQ